MLRSPHALFTVCCMTIAAHGEPETVDLSCFTVHTTSGTVLRLPGYRGGAIYLRDRAGRWVQAPTSATAAAGVGEITLRAGDLKGGRTQIVMNKPEWVELNDSEAPRVLGARCAGQPVTLTEGVGELSAVAAGQTVEVQVEDALNRISVATTTATLNGARVAGPVYALQRQAGNPKRATLRYTFPEDLGFGLWELRLCVRDEAPTSPTNEVVLRFRRFGVEVVEEGAGVRFYTRRATFTCRPEKQGLFLCDTLSARSARIAIQGDGDFQHTEGLAEPPKVLVDEPQRKVVSIRPALCFDKDSKPTDQFDLDLRCEIRAEWPGLLVTTKLTPRRDLARSYLFWSDFMAGDHYLGSDGSRGEWHPRYANIQPQGWIWLSPTAADRPGTGVITDGELSEYLGQSLLIFTKPKRLEKVKQGQATQVSFYYFPAEGADEVKAQAQLVELPD